MTHRGVAVVGALGPLVLALLGLAAWFTGFLRLASLRSDYIPMAPSTAIGFALLSTVLIAVSCDATVRRRHAARAAAALLSVLALIKLAEYLTGAALLNLEVALVAQPGSFGTVPLARMSPLTAVAFLLAGMALASLGEPQPAVARDVGGALGGVVALVGAIVVLGYVYGAPLLYGGRVVPMALTTGLAFIGIGVALVALAGPGAVPLKPFSGGSARARLMRVFLPLTCVAIVLNGVLTNVILAHVRANPALLAALFALVSAVVVGAAVSWTARALGIAIDRAEIMMRRSQDELEQRVRERTADLSVLNRELESFSYSVSHDLRAPLRHVLGFAAALQEEAGPQLDEGGRRYLAKVTEAAQRMNRLIDDLLELSRTGRANLEKRAVSLTSLVHEAQAEVTGQSTERQVVWHIQNPLPEVLADPHLFRLVLVNLLSNAIKYTALQTVAHIEIGSTSGAEGETVIFVRDNGVGFDMKYAHKLFGVFQRLHSADQFEGTGIGLANVSRIVRRHGGRTWAEGEVERGATFYVALPSGST
jgi:signal transduction histidine kinase